LAEFEIATASRDLSSQQLGELHAMAADIRKVLDALEARLPDQTVRMETGLAQAEGFESKTVPDGMTG